MKTTPKELFQRHQLLHIWEQIDMAIEGRLEKIKAEGHVSMREVMLTSTMMGIGLMSIIRDKDQREAFLKDYFDEIVTPVVKKNDTPEVHKEINRLHEKVQARKQTEH